MAETPDNEKLFVEEPWDDLTSLELIGLIPYHLVTGEGGTQYATDLQNGETLLRYRESMYSAGREYAGRIGNGARFVLDLLRGKDCW